MQTKCQATTSLSALWESRITFARLFSLWVAFALSARPACLAGGCTGEAGSGSTQALKLPSARVAFGHGLYVSVGCQGAIATSSNGISWVSRVSGTESGL